jgi:asparagine synthase (glutamine-hydrolysing)
MCGIAGALTRDPEVARRAVASMNEAQRHRGPDDGGASLHQVGDHWLALGSRRLAVIDLSPAGHQPMVAEPSGSCVAFNGEIYALNRPESRRALEAEGVRFRGHSDTEVLLHGLERRGVGWTRALDGMFAFAYYRAPERTLTLARDAAGIKPLYVARVDGALLFASEVRALLSTGLVPRRIDRAGLASFLAYGAVQEPLTLTAGVRSLEPGTALTLDLASGGERLERFWAPPAPRPAGPDTVGEIRHTLEREVRAHLVSDVPLGIFLSGGLDSTVIAGLAARGSARVVCYTVAVEPDDETALAAGSARLFGAEHHAIRLAPDEAAESARAWLGCMDQPTIDGLNSFIVARAARQAGVVVALCGQGGDELFGGYPSFRDVPALARPLRLAAGLPRGVAQLAARVAASGRTAVARDKALDLAASDGSLRSIYLHRRRLCSNRQMRALGFAAAPDGLTRDFVPAEPLLPECPGDPVASLARLEFATYLRSMLLRDADVATMASSLELRVPLLSRPVLDVLLGIPGAALLPRGQPPKTLERQAFADLLRPELLERPKQGFALPMAGWMRGPLAEECRAALAALERADVLASDGVRQVWSEFEREPDGPSWSRAWALVALGRFLA